MKARCSSIFMDVLTCFDIFDYFDSSLTACTVGEGVPCLAAAHGLPPGPVRLGST